jgi:hypothetical protein
MFVKPTERVAQHVRRRQHGERELDADDRAMVAELGTRVRPTAASRTRLLPVPGPLSPLLPDGALRRGTAVVCGGAAALSLALAMAGGVSATGSWCALVGVEDPGLLAAAGYGIDLARLAVVRTAPAGWATAAAALLDGLDLVVVEPPGRAKPAAARTLAARARDRGSVLVVVGGRGAWPAPADVELTVDEPRWHGLAEGAGRLQARRVSVSASGRGSAARAVRRELWLPAATGAVAAA